MHTRGENLNDLLGKQRDNVSKEGLGFPPKSKKKNKKKKTSPATRSKVIIFVKEGERAKEKGKAKVDETKPPRPDSPVVKTGVSGPSDNNFAGKYNLMYVLCRDYC